VHIYHQDQYLNIRLKTFNFCLLWNILNMHTL